MQVEHEKCMEIIFHLNAQIEPTLIPNWIKWKKAVWTFTELLVTSYVTPHPSLLVGRSVGGSVSRWVSLFFILLRFKAFWAYSRGKQELVPWESKQKSIVGIFNLGFDKAHAVN